MNIPDRTMWLAIDQWQNLIPTEAVLREEETNKPIVFDTIEEAASYARQNAHELDSTTFHTNRLKRFLRHS